MEAKPFGFMMPSTFKSLLWFALLFVHFPAWSHTFTGYAISFAGFGGGTFGPDANAVVSGDTVDFDWGSADIGLGDVFSTRWES